LFRIASEALINIRRHAQATEVELTLTRSATDVRLTIQDDGRGFDTKAASSGFGIAGMRERAALAGGTLAIQSVANRGTNVIAHVPLTGTPS
jgi:two-component system, NarL family, sensor histidine kinase UhpB